MIQLPMKGLRMSRKVQGFTLIELMIVVVIIGVLAAIVIPSYSDYVTRGRIPQATAGLASKRVQMEQFFQDNRTYAGAPACNLDTASSEFFNFSCAGTADADGFTLQAVGKGAMAGFTYTVDEGNSKTSTITTTGWTGNPNCWVTKKGGAC